jgi:uncharacterized membrane protein
MYKMRFAPVSGARSSALGFAAGWFFLNGAILALILVVGIVALILGKLGTFHPIMIANVAIGAITSGGLIVTGHLIGKSKLMGGYLGMFFILLGPFLKVFQGIRIDTLEWILIVIGVGIMASIWHELD